MPKIKLLSLIIISLIICPSIYGLSEQGKFDFVLTKNIRTTESPISKNLFAGSKIFLQITCDSKYNDTQIQINWRLRQTFCTEDDQTKNYKRNNSIEINSGWHKSECIGNHIILPEYKFTDQESSKMKTEPKEEGAAIKKPKSTIGEKSDIPIFTVTKDGSYELILEIDSLNGKSKDFNASIHIEMRGLHGYLSADEWPLLPFYATMCMVYVLYGIIWLLVSFLQWRDLLRIQFWISGVILLGMLEKAVFCAEYQSINTTGVPVQGAKLFAEWVSCAKRTLARMLVIIVSLGFGIVKPRLGPMLHRVVGTGALYFVLACVESYLRVMHKKDDESNQYLVASIPLAVLDSAICWWIFTSLVQTTRTLRLRRNMVKLSLYRHFTNTLIFSVIASVFFMLYSIKTHKLARCSDIRELWVDEAFWHILFSVLLLVIMILWRPTNNNQRYAFTPLLDNPEDEDDDDEEEQFVADAYGVKMRGPNMNSIKQPSTPKATTTEEDDLRWVEENIPSSISEPALPILDSDEEIINTKFEVSKMQ